MSASLSIVKGLSRPYTMRKLRTLAHMQRHPGMELIQARYLETGYCLDAPSDLPTGAMIKNTAFATEVNFPALDGPVEGWRKRLGDEWGELP